MPIYNPRILQWNAQGIRSKKDELSELIETHKTDIVAIQETKLWTNSKFSIPNYNELRKDGHYNRNPHGGVALYIHSDIPFCEIPLTTPLQAVAAKVTLHREITICNIYTSRSHPLNCNLLLDIFNQLPGPCIILGDFNAYNIMWGSDGTDARGTEVEEFITANDVALLNNGNPTRISYQTESAIDLSICSSVLLPDLQWSVLETPGDSDHCPIIISSDRAMFESEQNSPRWVMKQAAWELYATCPVWGDYVSVDAGENEFLLEDLYSRILTASHYSIPQAAASKFYPKPWWSEELKLSKQLREHLYQRYRHNKTLENAVAWKRQRAIHRKAARQHQRDSWILLVESMKFDTPSSKLYDNMRKIKGRAKKRISILKDDYRTYSSIPDIANKLAETFSSVSSTQNYPRTFIQHKENIEKQPINFDDDVPQIYNRPFSIRELQYALTHSNNTAPGEDGIHYQMLKHLPESAKIYLLAIFNKYFKESYFPKIWASAIVIPVPKPGKDGTRPSNYRPIALTSCVCKVFERLINERLIDYMDMHKIFSRIQCGCRRNRCTMDHLVRLERAVRDAFANGEHFVSLFFDLEKAYDMTWRYGILKDLSEAGLTGFLPKYIKSFLNCRKFKVRVSGHLSPSYVQENGVPQGAILSVTLFALKINSIATKIPQNNRFIGSLYVDDLQIGFRHPDLTEVRTQLQNCLNEIDAWTAENGFKFSIAKTKAMHFSALPGLHMNLPALSLGNNILPYTESMKFLGLIWDRKLNWREHIFKLKADCKKLIGMLKSITTQSWGTDLFCAIKVYRMYIRSKLDYGSPVYGSACQTLLKTMEPIANDALRVATGAFPTTPIHTLNALTNEMKLEERRDFLTLRYYYKMRSCLDNPAVNPLTSLQYQRIYLNKNLQLPIGLRKEIMLQNYGLRRGYVKPSFSYVVSNIDIPTWSIDAPNINFELGETPKSTTPHAAYIQQYRRLCRETYLNYEKMYTDGSKCDAGVGAAVVYGETTVPATLPTEASIFSAELYAICMALKLINRSEKRNFVVFSDSRSVLMAIMNIRTLHPIIRGVIHTVHDLTNVQRKIISFCWLPGHVGIKGNELADKAAVRAASQPEQLITLHYKDFYPVIQDAFDEKREELWRAANQKMYEVKPTVKYWDVLRGLTRKEEVVVNRLRTGHCKLTHEYLLDGEGPRVPPICDWCQDATQTVKHLLLLCPALANQRQQFRVFRGDVNMKVLLGEDIRVADVLGFLREIGAYNRI
jgi:ribonuclease HI